MGRTTILTVGILLLALLNLSNSAVTVNQLTGITSSNLAFSGYIPVSDTSSNQLFFTYYGIDGQTDQNALKNFPLIIVVGNPGSSSQYLNFGSFGPLILNNDLTTVANPNRLTQFANVMFIDLLGSGFSFANSSSDLPSDLLTFGIQLTYSVNQFVK
jgi:carboxypeptidase C (cathepsin A)